MKFFTLLAFATAMTGCAHQDLSARSTIVTPSAENVGGATVYRMTDGTVQVAMLPMVEMPALWLGQTATRALHVRVTYANEGMHAWTIYTRQQIAHVEDRGPSLPAGASRDPFIVTPGQTRALDLYYPVAHNDGAPSRFSLDWHVNEPGTIVAGETRIDANLALGDRARF